MRFGLRAVLRGLDYRILCVFLFGDKDSCQFVNQVSNPGQFKGSGFKSELATSLATRNQGRVSKILRAIMDLSI